MDNTTTLFLAEAANGLCLFEDRGSQAEPEALHRVSTVVWQAGPATQRTWLSAAHSFDVRSPRTGFSSNEFTFPIFFYFCPSFISIILYYFINISTGVPAQGAAGGVPAVSQLAPGVGLSAPFVRCVCHNRQGLVDQT
jgi:hypothetical protein